MKRALLVLLCAMLVPILPFVIIGELPGQRWLELSEADAPKQVPLGHAAEEVPLGYGFLFGALGAGLLALDVLLPIPSSIVGAMLGGRLGFAAGFFWAFAGLCTGQLVGYALGRALPARWSSELPEAPTVALTLLSRPVPVLAEAVAIAAGATRLPFAQFALAGAAGNAIYAAAMAGDGAALLPQGLLGPGLILPMLVPVLAYLAWRRLVPRA